MNILYFASTDFFQKPNPSFHLMKAMLDDILQAGHTVLYAGITYSHLDVHIPDDLKSNPHFKYSMVAMKTVQKKQFVRRFLLGVRYAFKSKRNIRRYAEQCDVVFLQSTPTILFNLLVTKRFIKKRKIVLNIQDMFPGSSIASGVLKNKVLQSMFFHMQRVAYRRADTIVAISEDMKVKLQEQGVPESKIRVILNWFDDQTVSEVKRDENRFIKKYNLTQDNFYVQYAGTMGYVFDYKMVLAVALKLKNIQNIEFHMIGEGSQKDAFMKEAKNDNLHNIHFFPLEPQNMVSDVYSACDVCLIPLKHGVIGNSVPSKAGLLMACKRPIITSVDKGCCYATELNENHVGIACSDDDPDAVASAILNLYDNRTLGVEMGLKGYEYGHIRYSRSTNMRHYLDLFSELS